MADVIFYIMIVLGVLLPIVIVCIGILYDKKLECKKRDPTIRPKIVDKYDEKANARVLGILNSLS